MEDNKVKKDGKIEIKDSTQLTPEPITGNSTPTTNLDKDLDDLLNDAIGDFEKPTKAFENSDLELEERNETSGSSGSNEWVNQFVEHVSEQFDGELKKHLEQMNDGKDLSKLLAGEDLSKLFENTEMLAGEDFRKLVKNTSELLDKEKIGEGSGESENLKETISETLRSLSEGIDNLQSSLPDELPFMFNGLNMADDSLMPFMHNIMEMFLSKDVLYPSMSALCKSFPQWLEQNKATLPEAEFEKFKKQYELMQVITKKLEEEDQNDPPDVKKERFKSLLDLMQELQKFGHPPKELVADAGVPIGMTGAPNLPMDLDPSNCSVM